MQGGKTPHMFTPRTPSPVLVTRVMSIHKSYMYEKSTTDESLPQDSEQHEYSGWDVQLNLLTLYLYCNRSDSLYPALCRPYTQLRDLIAPPKNLILA